MIRNESKDIGIELTSDGRYENDISLRPFHTLGFKRVRDRSIQHLERRESYSTDLTYKMGPKKYVVYQVGHHISFYNYEDKRHTIYSKKKGVKNVIAFCLCKKKSVIALSEEWFTKKTTKKDSNSPDDSELLSIPKSKYCVSYYSLGGKFENHLRLDPDQTTPVIVLDFSPDRKYLGGMTAPPCANFYLWKLGKNVELTKTRLPKFDVLQILFNPILTDQIQVSALSSNEVKLFRYQENELRHFDPLCDTKETFEYTKHGWYDDEKLLICTKTGEILILDHFNLVKVMKNIFGPDHPNCGIHCIKTIERGFIVGGDDGMFALYERSYDSQRFTLYKLFQSREKVRFIDLCLSRKEENVILAAENNCMYRFILSNIDILKSEDDHFISLPINFHDDFVVSADNCLQKSLLLTASADRTVRLWNFRRKKVEMTKKFDEEIYDLSLHPDGLKFLISLRYKVILYAILNNELYKCCEWGVRNCRKVCFSHGGHLFALCVGTRIMIFSSITYEIVDNLSGHTGIVKDIVWGANDQLIASAGYEGAIFVWQVLPVEESTNPKLDENLNKLCSFDQIIFDSERRETVGIGNSTKVWGYNEQEGKEIDTSMQLTSLALSLKNKTMFIGTSDGKILIYRWPFEKSHYKECQIHSGKVTQILLDYDERFLFSIDQNRTLYMLKIHNSARLADDTSKVDDEDEESMDYLENKEKKNKDEEDEDEENKKLLLDGENTMTKKWDNLEDLTFVLKTDLLEHENNITSLEEQVHQKMIEAERKINAERESKLKQIDKMQKKHENEINQLKQTIFLEQQRSTEKETEATHRINRLESEHRNQVKEFTKKFEELEDTQESIFEKKDHEKEKEIQKLEKEKETLKEFFKSKMNKIKEKFLKDKQQQIKSFNRLGQEYGMMNERLKTEKKQSDEDYHFQIEKQRSDFDKQIRKYRDEIDRLKKEHTNHFTKVNNFIDVIKKKDSKIDDIKTDLKKKNEHLEILQKKKVNLNLEKREKDKIIQLNDQKILSQKNEIQELEKLRLVLTHKFNSLKKEMKPKQNMIEKLSRRVKGMERELQMMKISKTRLRNQLSGQTDMEKILKVQILKLNQKFVNKKRLIELILKDLNNLLISTSPRVGSLKPKSKTIRARGGRLVSRYKQHQQQQKPEEEEEGDHETTLMNTSGGTISGGAGGIKIINEIDLKKILEKYSQQKKSIFTASRTNLKKEEKNNEFVRQRNYMEAKLSSLKSTLLKKEKNFKKDVNRKTIENSLLVTEINTLRQERKRLKKKLKEFQMTIRSQNQQILLLKRTLTDGGSGGGYTDTLFESEQSKMLGDLFRNKKQSRSRTSSQRKRKISKSKSSRPMTAPGGFMGRYSDPDLINQGRGSNHQKPIGGVGKVTFSSGSGSGSTRRRNGKLYTGSVYRRDHSKKDLVDIKMKLTKKLRKANTLMKSHETQLQYISTFVKKME